MVVKDKQAAQEDPEVLAAVDQVTRELGSDGRILLRASGTEPKIRVMVEATTDELCEQYVDRLVKVINDRGLAAE